MPIWTTDDIASIIIKTGQEMGITPRGIVIGLATGLVESNLTVYANAKVAGSLGLPHDAVGSDGFSVGVQQQQVVQGNDGQWWWGPVETCQDPTGSTRLFFQRLAKLDYNGPNTPGSYAQAVQASAYPDRYDQRMGDAQALYDQLTAGGNVPAPDPRLTALQAARPDFNEYPVWSNNGQPRAGTTVDLFLLHTEEGNMDADGLAHWLDANGVSYHYTISKGPHDDGVTVCDVVNTDQASWSCLASNNRSINLCFAGSYAGWTRQEWLDNTGRAIDVAAYLAVQDCIKYGIDPKVVLKPYDSDPPCIADHRYCTEYLQDGNTHVDVGDGFPKDVFAASVAKYSAIANGGQPPVPPTPPIDPAPTDPAFETMAQVRGRWEMLGWQTLVEAVAQLRDKVCATGDAGKSGFKW